MEKKKKAKHIKNPKNKNRKILSLFLVIFIMTIFSFVIWKRTTTDNNYQNENITFEETSNNIDNSIQQVKQYKSENQDVKGWISIPDTNINFPLLQTDNNEYYLTHNYNKEENYYGSIFINAKSQLDNKSSNVIIYGHNKKDDKMFNNLLKYENKDYYKEHSIIKIATDTELREYEIISIFKSKIYYKSDVNVFKYYNYIDFANEEEYNTYINNCKNEQLYDTGKTATYDEQLITLITCEYSQENGRFVVVGKRIK